MPPPTLRFRWAFLLALVLHGAAYLPSLPNGFVFDDHAIVEGKPAVTGAAPLRGVLSRPWFDRGSPDAAIDYRPLALASLGLDVRTFGLEPAPLRAENIVWGALGAALLGLLAAELGAGRFASGVVVSLFSLHPVRSDVVLSIVGRAELLSLAASAGAILLALRSARSHGRRRCVLAAVSGLVLAAGLLSKETAFAAPLLLAAVVLAASRPESWREKASALAPAASAWAVTLGAVLSLRVAVLGGALTGPAASAAAVENKLAARPPEARVAGALAMVPLAARRLVWPARLVADYGSNAVADSALREPARIAAGAALVLACACASLLARSREGLVALGFAWCLLSYLPFANFAFPTAVLFTERLLFFPAGGVALVVGGAVGIVPARFRRLAVLVTVVLCVSGAARVWSRAPEWSDDRSLFTATVRDVPGNGRAWLNLAVLSLARGEAGRAQAELIAGLAADPALRPRVEGMLRHAETLGRADLRDAVRAALSTSR